MKRVLRDVNGILLLDKPTGVSSNSALQQVKRLFGGRKAGHTGSLDPLATGVLPICFGEATKFSRFLLESDKHYVVTARLGITTDTSDSEGKVVKTRSVPTLSSGDLEIVLERFRGQGQQVPSMFSALKHQGQPLYKYARKGIEVEREPRDIVIYQLLMTELTETTVTLEVKCSKGTYIRTLVEDIGEVLGCGAHVIALRRMGAGPFSMSQAVTIDQVKTLADSDDFTALDAKLLPIHSALQGWPELSLCDQTAYFLSKGQAVQVPHAPTQGWVSLTDRDNHRFLGVGEILDDGRVAPRRLVKEVSVVD